MNFKQSYEHLIAQKLRKLPVPDADASWQQMQRRLDEDGDMRPSDHKRRPGGWWRLGVLAILAFTGVWVYLERSSLPPTLAHQPPAEKTMPNKTNATTNQKAAIDNNTTLTLARPETITPSSANAASAGAIANAREKKHIDQPAISATAPSSTAWPSKTTVATTQKPSSYSVDHNVNAYSTRTTSHEQGHLSLPATAGEYPAQQSALTPENDPKNTPTGLKQFPATSGNRLFNRKNNRPAETSPHADPFITGKNAGNNLLPESPVFATIDASDKLTLSSTVPVANMDALTQNQDPGQPGNAASMLNSDTRKAVARAQRDNAIAEATKRDNKGLHLNLSNVFRPISFHVDTDPRWAAGISLNSPVMLGAQNRYNRNINAGKNLLSDYLPSAYLQFHLNDVVYAQAELNFISPQYTPEILMDRQTMASGTPGSMINRSIYLEKLYYFNIPFTLHYSPVNNFYLSAGIQFSSLQSGVARLEDYEYTSGTSPMHGPTNTVLKFKDDSIAARISPNEWRWTAGADYYWNRFTIGLHYNQSLSKTIVAQQGGALPATSLRNQALFFSVRYNLFESRKK